MSESLNGSTAIHQHQGDCVLNTTVAALSASAALAGPLLSYLSKELSAWWCHPHCVVPHGDYMRPLLSLICIFLACFCSLAFNLYLYKPHNQLWGLSMCCPAKSMISQNLCNLNSDLCLKDYPKITHGQQKMFVIYFPKGASQTVVFLHKLQTQILAFCTDSKNYSVDRQRTQI